MPCARPRWPRAAICPAPPAIYGAVSLIFWALVIVVTVKYVVFIMRADNNGEGGVLALAALAHRAPVNRAAKTAIGIAALLGLALFYGDGMLTPAISVLSAMEGLSVGGGAFTPLIVPLTLVILVGLFFFQSRGTEKIGKVFGPVMVLWFIVIAVLGAVAILKSPQILLRRRSPLCLGSFCPRTLDGLCRAGFGGVGGDGLRGALRRYGPFRAPRHPLGLALFRLSRPDPELFRAGCVAAVASRTTRPSVLCPGAVLGALSHGGVGGIATIIASQAVISGVFSITRQAVQLGQLPRMEIRHTSATERGQIYRAAHQRDVGRSAWS